MAILTVPSHRALLEKYFSGAGEEFDINRIHMDTGVGVQEPNFLLHCIEVDAIGLVKQALLHLPLDVIEAPQSSSCPKLPALSALFLVTAVCHAEVVLLGLLPLLKQPALIGILPPDEFFTLDCGVDEMSKGVMVYVDGCGIAGAYGTLKASREALEKEGCRVHRGHKLGKLAERQGLGECASQFQGMSTGGS